MRWILNVAAAVSALLFAALVVLWVRSYWKADDVMHRWPIESAGGGGEQARACADRGAIFIQFDSTTGVGCQLGQVTRETVFSSWPTGARDGRFFDWFRPHSIHAAGFWYVSDGYNYPLPYAMPNDSPLYSKYTMHLAVVPIAFPTILSILFPVTWALRYRRSRRRKVGQCVRCGDDLRATPGRCPECGMTPNPKGLRIINCRGMEDFV